MPAVLVAGIFILLVGGGVTWKVTHDSNKRSSTLNAHTVSFKAEAVLAKDGDMDKDGKTDGGDTLHFTFKLTNKSQAEAKYLDLDTKIPKDRVFYVRNYAGSSSAATENGTIVFKNVVVLPNQTQEISFDASLFYDTKDWQLNFTPEVREPGKSRIAQANAVSTAVSKADTTSLPSMTTINREGQ
jgi:hypothetical protein